VSGEQEQQVGGAEHGRDDADGQLGAAERGAGQHVGDDGQRRADDQRPGDGWSGDAGQPLRDLRGHVFIGILLAVATLTHAGILTALADWLDATVGRLDLIVIAIGFVSAIVDNVPMVAGAMGMYSMEVHPQDSFLWEFLAYCAGTGGSIFIIGSAAGVAAMGLEKIDFIWYMKRFSLLAIVGYLAGAAAYIAQYQIVG
jgi:hypothetical protein